MKNWKLKIFVPLIFILLLVGAKLILWNFPVSSGKRVGNLTKFSKKGKFWFTKTWEGTIDEGSGDKLTSYFSVSDEEIANELYSYEGREVIIYYNQYIFGWPRDTNYDVLSWKPKKSELLNGVPTQVNIDSELIGTVERTLFCTMLGALYKDPALYKKVKDYIQKNNLYLYKQYTRCNE